MKKRMNLGVAIFISMVLGIIVGAVIQGIGVDSNLSKTMIPTLSSLGNIFIKLIKMLVIPLVAVSIISGAASLGETKSAGKVGIGTFIYYMCTTAVAVVMGLIAGNIVKPGIGLDLSKLASETGDKLDPTLIKKGDIAGFWDTLEGIIPPNPVLSLVEGNMLQILFFCIFFGIGLSVLEATKKNMIVDLLNATTEVFIWMITKIMYIAPIGVFGLMASSIATFGWQVLNKLVLLLIIYIIILAIQTFGVYTMLVKLLSKISPIKFIKKISRAQIVALSTSSSAATLPVTFDVCEKELGVSNGTSSFVLPLGATINMDGNAIYYALVAVFFAQAYGIDLSIGSYIAIIITATIGSIGQAGVPGPSLLVVAVLIAAKIPVEALPILFGVDRIFDMLRTAVNITGDASCAVIIDELVKEE